MSLRFIEAPYTPTGNNSFGWAVPPARFISTPDAAERDLKRLKEFGLTPDEHFYVVRHGNGSLKRVVFHSDMAFVQAKMILA